MCNTVCSGISKKAKVWLSREKSESQYMEASGELVHGMQSITCKGVGAGASGGAIAGAGATVAPGPGADACAA